MADKKHNFTGTEIKAGLLVILSAVVLVGFVAVIKGMRPPQEANTYFAKFTKINGLDAGADVRFGGVLAGRVIEIAPDPEDQSQILVKADVWPNFPVNDASETTVGQTTLTAAMHLEISTGSKDANPLPPGSTIPAITTAGGFIDMSGMDALLADARDFLGVEEAKAEAAAEDKPLPTILKIASDIRNLIGIEEALEKSEEDGTGEIPSVMQIAQDIRDLIGVPAAKEKAEEEGTEFPSVTEITGSVTGVFEKFEPTLTEILDKVAPIEDSVQDLLSELNDVLEDNRPTIESALGNLDGILSDAATMVDSLEEQLQGLLDTLQDTLNNTEGLTGEALDFLEDNRPAIEDIILDLQLTLRNLNEFSRTLSEQPQAVIRGKTPEGRKN